MNFIEKSIGHICLHFEIHITSNSGYVSPTCYYICRDYDAFSGFMGGTGNLYMKQSKKIA